MARIRSLKPEFWTSEQIVECSTNARLMFIGMWTFSDDAGVHKASLMRLKMEIFPSDPFDTDTISRLVGELIDAGLVEEYEVEGSPYWQVTGWVKHQRIDQPTYRYPIPSGSVPASIQRRSSVKEAPNVRRTFDEHSLREGSGVERNEKKSPVGDLSTTVARVVEASDQDSCPHEQIIALYHELLPTMRHVRDWTPARRKLLRARWRTNAEYRSLDWWRGFFQYVGTSDFLLGRSVRNGDRAFEADLEWLIRPTNFIKVIEGRYHQMEAA
jgi:hypothetical protein